MKVKSAQVHTIGTCLLLCATVILPATGLAGSAAIGLIARSVGTTLEGQELRFQTALFSGDALQVSDSGLAILRLSNGSGIVLSPRTVASFEKQAGVVTVKLDHGGVSLSQPRQSHPLRVEAADVSIEPVRGYPTLGEVAMRDGMLTVKAQEGRLRVNGRDVALEASKNQPVILDTRRAAASKPAAGAPGHAVAAGSAAAKTAALAAVGTGASIAVTQTLTKEKNPIAVARVAANVPDQACEHAASPSVPAAACGDR